MNYETCFQYIIYRFNCFINTVLLSHLKLIFQKYCQMHRYFIFIFLFITKLSFCQIQISWEDLEDVEFSDMYIDSINEYILYPHFGPNVRELHDKKVSISGYVLVDPDKGYYVLSKGPFVSCFFVGWRAQNRL